MWAIKRFASDGDVIYWRGIKGTACWSRLLGEAIAFARQRDANNVINGLGLPGIAYNYDLAMVRGHDEAVLARINGT